MFAAERDGKFSGVEQFQLRGEEFAQHFFEGAVLRINGRPGGDADFAAGIELEFFVVEFHVAAGFQDRAGTVARAALVSGGAFQRHGKDDCTRRLVCGKFFGKSAEIVRRHGRVSGHVRSGSCDAVEIFLSYGAHLYYQCCARTREFVLPGVLGDIHYTCEDAEWQRKRARPDVSCTIRWRTASLRFIRWIFRAYTRLTTWYARWARRPTPRDRLATRRMCWKRWRAIKNVLS